MDSDDNDRCEGNGGSTKLPVGPLTAPPREEEEEEQEEEE